MQSAGKQGRVDATNGRREDGREISRREIVYALRILGGDIRNRMRESGQHLERISRRRFAGASANVVPSRTHRQIFVAKFAPNADHFHAFGFVCLHQEFVAHRRSPAEKSPAHLPSAHSLRQRDPACQPIASTGVTCCGRRRRLALCVKLLTSHTRQSIYPFTRTSSSPTTGARTFKLPGGSLMSANVRPIPEGY